MVKPRIRTAGVRLWNDRMKAYEKLIDKYYPVGSLRRDIYLRHCRSVADLAVEIAVARRLMLGRDEIVTAAMLHDIGIFLTDAPDIGCEGESPYILHGLLGGMLLRDEGYDEKYARVAELHTGSGISVDEVVSQNLPLPVRDYLPETLLEKLICYADKFYSKSGEMKKKPLTAVRASMAKISAGSLNRFDELDGMFGTEGITC